jgi:chromosome partitioning protein
MHMGRVIAVSNLKGGIAKTTTVVNLGAGLALKGARVLLVDVDAQGNLALALGVRPRRTLYEVVVDGAPAADCVHPARPNLDLIASDSALLSVQPVIARRPDWSRALEQGLRPLFGAYDFILIDSGGSLTMLNANALVCASDVLVPTAVEHFSVKSIELLFEHVTRVKGHSGSIRMIIPTLYDPRVRQSGELLADLRTRYGALVTDPVRVNVRLSEAPTRGRTIYEYDPRSRGAADYAQLVERVSDTFGFSSAPPSPTRQAVLAPIAAPAPVTAPATPVTVPAAPEPTPVTAPAIPEPKPSPVQPPRSSFAPAACPNCGHVLQHATMAGYRVSYCDHCKYKTQTLAGGPRR